jgi:hypothetical protein
MKRMKRVREEKNEERSKIGKELTQMMSRK